MQSTSLRSFLLIDPLLLANAPDGAAKANSDVDSASDVMLTVYGPMHKHR
jgi:hypothetical protein